MNNTVAVLSANKSFLKSTELLLTGKGFQALFYPFNSAEHAHKQMVEGLHNLILLDLHMHMRGNTGLELLKLLRLDPITARVPIIMCSDDVRSLRQKAALLERLNCHLVEKPFDPEQLITMIKELLEAHAVDEPAPIEEPEAATEVEDAPETVAEPVDEPALIEEPTSSPK